MSKEIDRFSYEENSLRQKCVELERSLTLITHDLRERERRLEQESEQRRDAEKRARVAEEKAQAEVAARAQMSTSSQHSSERLSQLERQVRARDKEAKRYPL